MLRLNTIGQDKVVAVLLLLTCLGVGQPVFAAPLALDQTIADFSTPEDSSPMVFDLQQSFKDGNGSFTYTVSSSNSSIVDATNLTNGGRDLTLTYQPNANGVVTITVTATDQTPSSISYSFNVTVTPVNDPPVANAQAVTTAEDTAAAITLTATDVDGDALTFAIGAAPAHGTLTGTAPNVTYTPAANYNGPDSFTFTANDGTVGALATVSITVTPVNDPPVATAQAVATAEDTPRAITLTGTDVDGNPLTFAVGTAPTHGVLSGTAPNLTYTPAANYNGPDSFTFTANDGTATSAPATVSINITPVNDAPVAFAQVVTLPEDSSTAITLVGTDVDGDPLTYAIGTLPAHGTLGGSGANRTYTPAANYNGPDSFTFAVSDGTLNSVGVTVTINVTPVNDPPAATAQAVATAEDTAAPITLAGTDVDGDPLTFAIGTPPTHGTLTGAGANRTYTPAANYNGPDSFTFTVNDGTVSSPAATVSITVNAVNDPPVLVSTPTPVNVAEDSSAVVVSLAGMFTDPDILTNGDTLTLSVSGVSNGALFSSPPVVSGSSVTLNFAPNQNGVSNVTIQARDAAGATATGNVAVTVTPVNDAPTLTTPIADINAPEDSAPIVLALNSNFSDVDIATNGDVLTYTVTANDNPALLTTSVAGSNLTLTFLPNANGVANLTVQARDSSGASVSDSFVVTVNAVDDVPVAVDDSAVMDEDSGTIDIDVLANDTHGDDPTTVISAGRTWTIGGTDYPNSSDSTPTSVLDATGTNVTLPNGSVSINGNIISYTPKQDFNGTDTFTYTIQDVDGETSTATVTVTINPVNDAPVQGSTVSYTVVQGGILDILAAGGIVSHGFDADSDPITVIQDTVPTSIGTAPGYPGTTLGLQPDGSFIYSPDPAFVGTDSFVIRLYDGQATSAPITVVVNVTPAPPPPPPPPPGEVEFNFNLAKVPLEDAISSEANVLVIMDDSGSMDWAVMTDGAEGEFWLTNAGIKDARVGTATTAYQYLVQLNTNVYGGNANLPTEAALAADPAFNTNNYGVWRGWNAQYNTVYYDPKVQYKPWVGLNRSNVDFPNASPTAAPLDPYDAVIQTINLTTPITYISNNVPIVKGNAGSTKNLSNNNVYLPRYYTTTAVGRPAWNAPHTLVEIRNNGTTYAGGPARADCAVDDGDPLTCTYAQEIQNFANWFTYYRSREYTAKAALGRTVADVTNVRLGYVVLNDANERLPVASMNASYRVGNKKAMMNQIYKIDSNNGTPLRVALDKAGRYFECKKGDSFGSTTDTAPGNARCPILPSPEGQCQNNFALLFSDGTWNETFTVAANGNAARNNDGDHNTLFDGGKYADAISGTLADVAMYYYERDLQPTLANGVPTTQRDVLGAPAAAFTSNGELMHQHMKTYTVAIGLSGLIDKSTIPVDYTQPFAWGDPTNDGLAKIDDMLHAAVNGRGDFLKANDPVMLSQALQSAFQEFSNGSVSVSAVAFNSTALREQTVEFRGFFNLKYNSGDLRALNVDATNGLVDEANPIWQAANRLDSITPANRVIVTYDRINDRGAPFRYASLNVNQKAVLDTNEVDYLRGVRTLEEPNGSYRARPQFAGLLGDIVHSAPQFVGGPRAIRRDQSPYPTNKLYSAFKDLQAAREPLVYVAANDGMMHGFNATTGNERFAYVPNKLIDSSQRFKNDLDQLTSLTYSHRFFVDLTPSVEDVFMPPKKGDVIKDWTTVLVGGLGGGGKGYYALNVSTPATDYASEATAKSTVLWEFTDADDTYPVDALGVPLGGAVGAKLDLGGSPIKDLGYAYSAAQIVMSNINDTGSPTQKKWVSVFGNGYNSTAGIAKLFVLPIEDGLDGWQAADVIKVDTGEGVKAAPDTLAGLPNGLGTPTLIDTDLNGTADIAYAGDLFGNLYRFNISDSNPANWKATKLFQATYTNGATTTRQPITTQPYVFKHPTQPGFIIIIGTGSYITETDGVSTEIQSVYGIWDRGEVNPATANANAKATRLVRQTVTNVVNETGTTFQKLRIVSANPVVYTPDAGVVPGVYGWYFDFVMTRPTLTLQGNVNPDTDGKAPPSVQFPGERAIRRFVPRGTALLVTTVIPRDANTCLRSPPGSTFPIDALTGGNPTRPILDLNNDGKIDAADMLTVGGVQYAAGILFSTSDLNGQLVDPSLLLGTGDADFLFLSGGDEQITIRVAGPEDAKTGRLSWRELDNAN